VGQKIQQRSASGSLVGSWSSTDLSCGRINDTKMDDKPRGKILSKVGRTSTPLPSPQRKDGFHRA